MAIPKIDLSSFIEKWKSAKRGKEVRQANVDAFEQIQEIVNQALQQCYDEATGNPESILAHTGNTDNPHGTNADNLQVTDTYGAAGTAGSTVFMQVLADALADKIVNQMLTKSTLVNNALATEAGVAALDAAMGKTLQDQITQQNSNLRSDSIFGTHNKPSGTYKGNGSATSRTIDIGGVGNVIAIYTGAALMILTAAGGIGKNISGELVVLSSSEACFSNGVLTLVTNNGAINYSGSVYAYQVL